MYPKHSYYSNNKTIIMGECSVGKRKGNGDIGRICSHAWRDIKCAFARNVGTGVAFGLAGPCASVRIAIFVMIGLVLLFSGISLFSWIILAMLIILLNFC